MPHFMAGETPTAEGVTAPLESVVAAPAEAAPVILSDSPSVVSAEAVAEPTPQAEPAAAEAVAEPVVEAAPEPEAAPESVVPTYEAFKVPEGLTLPDERVAEFTGVLGKYGLTQEAGQELLDLHASNLSQMQTQMDQRQRDAFADTRRSWREDFYKSAGNRSDTMANDAKWAITQLVKDTAQRKELYTVLDNTGAGDHKAVIGLLARAARVMREQDAPPQGLPPRGPARTAAERRYNK
jgi:hypothetical protein